MLFIFSEAVLFLSQFAKRQVKAVGLFGFMALTYLVGVSSPKHNLDYPNYKAWYDAMPTMPPSSYHFEKGYSYLSVYFAKLGLSYAEFRLLICACAMILLYIGVRRFTQNAALFAALYGATVFFVDATQMRDLLMLSFCVLAMSLLKRVTVVNVLAAVILVLISTQFHSLGYIFLVPIMLRLIPFDWLYKYALTIMGISIAAIGTIAVVGIKGVMKIIGVVVGLLTSRANLVAKLNNQYSFGSALIRYVIVAVATLAAVLLVWYLYRWIEASGDQELITKYQVIFSTVMAAVVLLPMLSLADTYSRIPRAFFLFVILAICLYYEHLDELKLSRMRSLITVAIILICCTNGFAHFFTWGGPYRASFLYITGIL